MGALFHRFYSQTFVQTWTKHGDEIKLLWKLDFLKTNSICHWFIKLDEILLQFQYSLISFILIYYEEKMSKKHKIETNVYTGN